jgi:nicotinamidase-related amidase
MTLPMLLVKASALLAVILIPAIVLGAGGSVSVRMRTRVQPFHNTGTEADAYFDGMIQPSRTAIVITDMWDKHWCKGATRRVGEIALKMEPVLEQARKAGVLIIHAPSDTMNFYQDTPARLLARNAPKVTPPPDLHIEDGPLPIDDKDGGCDTPGDKEHQAWTREIATLTIAPGDVVSDDGSEIYSVLQQHHIDTVLFMGVHANMCILNRSFGIRQLTKWGIRCILVRDLTDAMYNPASRPFVSHAEGTEMVIQFIERYWAPTTTTTDLLKGLGSPSSLPGNLR